MKASETRRAEGNDADDPGETHNMCRDDTHCMEDTTEPTGEPTPAAEAFGAIANEARVGILQALRDAEEPRSFSALRKDVGIYDSGRFNYHLGELEGRFVRNAGEGYELTYAGRQVVGSIRSGIYTDRAALEPVDAGECFDCGGALQATYEEEMVEIGCADCEQTVSMFGAPPALLEGFDRLELPLAFSRWVVTAFQRTSWGFCPDCSGRARLSHTETAQELEDILTVVYTCEVCELSLQAPLGVVVLNHPTVVAFHDDHGIDLQETLVWQIPWLFEDHTAETSEDPPRLCVTPEVDGDRISLVLDGDMSVVSVDLDP